MGQHARGEVIGPRELLGRCRDPAVVDRSGEREGHADLRLGELSIGPESLLEKVECVGERVTAARAKARAAEYWLLLPHRAPAPWPPQRAWGGSLVAAATRGANCLPRQWPRPR